MSDDKSRLVGLAAAMNTLRDGGHPVPAHLQSAVTETSGSGAATLARLIDRLERAVWNSAKNHRSGDNDTEEACRAGRRTDLIQYVERALHPCGDGCRYSKDVSMWPEYSCAECVYDRALDEAQEAKSDRDALASRLAASEADRAALERRVAELSELARKATPGPWRRSHWAIFTNEDLIALCDGKWYNKETKRNDANARSIVACVNFVFKLLEGK